MWKQKFKITLTPAENSIVIQSLNRLRNTLLREKKIGTPAAWMIFCSKSCAPLSREFENYILFRLNQAVYSFIE